VLNNPARLSNVDALRGLAALAVAWFHLTNTWPADWVRFSGSGGWRGVDCFFVISGFVIPYSMHRADYRVSDFWRFIARRMARLEPPYLISVALCVLLMVVSSRGPGFRGATPDLNPGRILAHLLYLIPLTKFDWVNPVYWTLAYEFVFYICCGLLFSILWRRHIFWTALLAFSALGARWEILHGWDYHILLFPIGIAAARLYTGTSSTRDAAAVMVLMAATIAALGSIVSGAVGLFAAAWIVWCRFPDFGPLTALGSISYSLYLIHVPIGGRIINLGRRVAHGALAEDAISLIALLASLAAAAMLYRWVEKPALNLAHSIPLRGVARRIAVRESRGGTPA
jgi:peptidoglycan/LPS O-acetylase OafA/YrhL